MTLGHRRRTSYLHACYCSIEQTSPSSRRRSDLPRFTRVITFRQRSASVSWALKSCVYSSHSVFANRQHRSFYCKENSLQWKQHAQHVVALSYLSPPSLSAARTRYAHQVTALSLSIIRKHAYTRYTAVCEDNGAELLSFKTWCIHCKNCSVNVY